MWISVWDKLCILKTSGYLWKWNKGTSLMTNIFITKGLTTLLPSITLIFYLQYLFLIWWRKPLIIKISTYTFRIHFCLQYQRTLGCIYKELISKGSRKSLKTCSSLEKVTILPNPFRGNSSWSLDFPSLFFRKYKNIIWLNILYFGPIISILFLKPQKLQLTREKTKV